MLVSIDVEVYEHDPMCALQAGIAMLDTRCITNIPPGKGCRNWIKRIDSRHLVAAQYSDLFNTAVSGGLANLVSGTRSEEYASEEIEATVRGVLTSPWDNGENCKIVFISHGSETEAHLQRALSIDLDRSRAEDGEKIDNQAYSSHKRRPTDLRTLLLAMQIPLTGLNNAGNECSSYSPSMPQDAVL